MDLFGLNATADMAVICEFEPESCYGPSSPTPEIETYGKPDSYARLSRAFRMPEPVDLIHDPYRLTGEERARLKELTGIGFNAIIRGRRGDGRVGLVWRKGVSWMSKSYVGASLIGIEISEHDVLHEKDPTLFALLERYDEDDFEGIQFVHRTKNRKRREKRAEGFMEFHKTLTPSMQSVLSAIHFHGSCNYAGLAMIGKGTITLKLDDFKGSVIYHEVAHLHRSREVMHEEKERWEEKVGDVYVGMEKWHLTEDHIGKGFITQYASSNPSEDVAELTGRIYAKPEYVKEMIERSPIFEWKIEWLYRNGFIWEDQLEYLMPEKANEIVEAKLSAQEGTDKTVAQAAPTPTRRVMSWEKGFFEKLFEEIGAIFS